MERDITVHPQSLRAQAYRVQQALYGGRPIDDSVIGVRSIEEMLIEQYALIVKKDDQDGIRLGAKPDSSRLSRTIVTLEQPDDNLLVSPAMRRFRRTSPIGAYMHWNGKPYIASVSKGSALFVPATSVFALESIARRTGHGAYYPEGDLLHTYLTERTLAVGELLVTGILSNPFGTDVNDPLRWDVPMPASKAQAALMSERAEIRLKGGPVATWQRKDQVNNGTENSINKP